MPRVILASSSAYTIEQLKLLQIDFESISPEIDDSLLNNEKPEDYVCRLAQQKGCRRGNGAGRHRYRCRSMQYVSGYDPGQAKDPRQCDRATDRSLRSVRVVVYRGGGL